MWVRCFVPFSSRAQKRVLCWYADEHTPTSPSFRPIACSLLVGQICSVVGEEEEGKCSIKLWDNGEEGLEIGNSIEKRAARGARNRRRWSTRRACRGLEFIRSRAGVHARRSAPAKIV